MPYPILNPASPSPDAASRCAMAIMSKAPRPGKVKTRLAPPLSLEESAALNICFLRDTAENLAAISATGGSAPLVCYTPVGDEAAFDDLLPDGFSLIAQRGDAFGERLLAAAEDILACGFAAVCLIDSDSPTVPAAAFEMAVAALARPGDRIVLGPSHDGGYYLIGLKQPHAEVFDRITWSTSTVLAETIERARDAGIEVELLPLWYDVDDAATLGILYAEVLDATPPEFTIIPGYPAPHTRAFLIHARTCSGPNASHEVTGSV
jgi:rSAM/selenodomain-associated transferase 1